MIFAAPELTGATRLAATACSRIGAGLVTVLAKSNADLFRHVLPAEIMVRSCDVNEVNRANVLLGGSGGIDADHFRDMLNSAPHQRCVFDAAAMPKPGELTNSGGHSILTPHEGEFAKAFPELSGTRSQRAQQAAKLTGGTIVLKGAETIIASADGRCVVNQHASPTLASAGTGDVLAGMIAGLAAQGMENFWAACAAVWMHGDAAICFGPGLIASDIAKQLPTVLSRLHAHDGW